MINDLLYVNDCKTNKDHVATPRWIVENIYNLIDICSFQNIWLPFDNYDSQFKLKADELNLNYKASHLFDINSSDFFKTEPPYNCDLMISNPPFSLQNKIIDRSFKLVESNKIKSFALLLPLSTLETPTRADIYNKYIDDISILIFKKRIKFENCKTSFNTACCWVCYKIPTIKKNIMWI